VPQFKIPPHPSPVGPQESCCWAQVIGGHIGGMPHTPFMPPAPQLSPMGHAPQSSIPPQPSEVMPQLSICWAQV
jgi:hypothetical protein